MKNILGGAFALTNMQTKFKKVPKKTSINGNFLTLPEQIFFIAP